MIDAYEIGIRIALDDGISAGIAAMTRELRALDKAAEASLANVAALRQAGVAASAPLPLREPPVPPQPASPDEQPVAVTPAPSAAAPTADQDAPAVAPLPASAPLAPVREDSPSAPAVPASASPLPARENATAPTPQPVVRTVSVERVTVQPPAAPVPATPAVSAPAPSEPVSERPAPVPAPVVPPAPGDRLPPPRRETAPPARVARAPAPARVMAPTIDVSVAASVVMPEQQGGGAPTLAGTIAPARPIAPERATASPATLQDTETPDSITGNLSAAPRETATPSRPNREQADQPRTESVYVYIDGAMIGRWMTDHLARATNRPTASATGFDPRIGPAWPGAPIGH